MGVENGNNAAGEIDDDVLADILTIAELIKPYYQLSFDEISIERDNEGRYFIVTDRTNFDEGEPIKVEVTESLDGSLLLIEGDAYVTTFRVAMVGHLSFSQGMEIIRGLAHDYGTQIVDGSERFGLVSTVEDFADSYSKLLEFLTEVTAATATFRSIKTVKDVN